MTNLILATQTVIVYRSQREQAIDQFLFDNPWVILVTIGVIALLLIGACLSNFFSKWRMKQWKKKRGY
jgi:hypothetical protein